MTASGATWHGVWQRYESSGSAQHPLKLIETATSDTGPIEAYRLGLFRPLGQRADIGRSALSPLRRKGVGTLALGILELC